MANILDPVWAFNTKSSSLLLPTTPTSTTKASSLPTIVPTLPHYERIGDVGTKTLWVVFILMLLSSLAFIVMAWRVPVQKRLFHILTALITTTATLSYFAMATGSGTTYTYIILREIHNHGPDTFQHIFRQVFWARYVDWALTTPLILLDLSFLAGLAGADILVVVAADIIMILTSLFAALASRRAAMWSWYAMACVAYLFIVYVLAMGGRRSASARGPATSKLFVSIGLFTLVVWTLYPIVWGISGGARKWSVDAEVVAYAVLDFAAKPVFGFWLLWAHARDVAPLEGFWSRGLEGEGGVRLDDEA